MFLYNSMCKVGGGSCVTQLDPVDIKTTGGVIVSGVAECLYSVPNVRQRSIELHGGGTYTNAMRDCLNNAHDCTVPTEMNM